MLEKSRPQPLSPQDSRLLMTQAREAKEFLTHNSEAPINTRLSTGEVLDLKLDVETFASITQTLISKTLQSVKKALRDAGLTPEEIKGCLLYTSRCV